MNRPLLLSVLIALVSITSSIAQSFEGRIVTTTEVVDAPAEMQSMKAMMETKMTTWMKGAKSRLETNSPFLGLSITLTDYDKKEVVTCMNMMGQKKAIVSSMDEAASSQPTMPTNLEYKETGKTKTICGYTCHETIGTYTTQEGEKLTMSVWYCKTIPNRNIQYGSLSGLPMEYTMSMQGMTMKITTIEVHKESVSDDMFVIPEGYTRTTQEEMRKSMGGKK